MNWCFTLWSLCPTFKFTHSHCNWYPMANLFDGLSPKLQVKSNNYQVGLWIKKKIGYVIFETSLGQCLLVHGGSDGSLACPDIDSILEYNRVDFIVCCHPAKVVERYPHLKPLMAWEDCPDVTWHRAWSHKEQGKTKTTVIAFGLTEGDINKYTNHLNAI